MVKIPHVISVFCWWSQGEDLGKRQEQGQEQGEEQGDWGAKEGQRGALVADFDATMAIFTGDLSCSVYAFDVNKDGKVY